MIFYIALYMRKYSKKFHACFIRRLKVETSLLNKIDGLENWYLIRIGSYLQQCLAIYHDKEVNEIIDG
jgi:hypothetical protein